ncbi:hypothetical protein O163_11410 [Caldanaerobacter subterraneus subsp. yonseiensis KB-1]|uniref:PIN domain-containing protein n=1 Tax=Caldanaerobacter subterraneus subsp. yonseiensis KB-1 TaxID=1388761 RepID=U5CSZ1_CALSX|nr:PIN domain-containing protein [Caldanaerobacter subterraneus]ERM91232.1 hypothetical protein O163_11410 [Caldanaerobacter subterraneus subsp. yonseiensis KB-1]
MIDLFIKDLRFKKENTKPFNSIQNIRLILDYFPNSDKNIVLNKSNKELLKVNFKKYFNQIYKKGNRELLRIYFKKAVEIEKEIEENLHLKYISINRQTVQIAQEYMIKNMVGVNDAYHFAIAVQNNLDYLLTLDGDFEQITHVKNTPSVLKV